MPTDTQMWWVTSVDFTHVGQIIAAVALFCEARPWFLIGAAKVLRSSILSVFVFSSFIDSNMTLLVV